MVDVQIRIPSPPFHDHSDESFKRLLFCARFKGPEGNIAWLCAGLIWYRCPADEILQTGLERVRHTLNIEKNVAWRWRRQSRQAFPFFNRFQQFVNELSMVSTFYL